METEGVPPRAKKRRPEASERQEPVSESQGEGEEGVDRISPLPDAILGDIISLLPTKDGIRTQILATRWRHLWFSAPLNLDHSSLPADEEVQVGLISRILTAHPGPARRFSLLVGHLHHQPYMVDAWLQSQSLENLQELEFHLDNFIDISMLISRVPLPVSAFGFSDTLRVLVICRCHLLDGVVQTFRFPQLRQLALDCVKISEIAMHSIISACPVLEYLLLRGDSGFNSLRINSPSLRGIGMSSGELIIEDAPMLERLLHLDWRIGLNTSVISAPKLETVGIFGISNFPDSPFNSKLVFGTSVVQKSSVVSFTTVQCSINILALGTSELELDIVIDFLRCFPCLERLYIASPLTSGKNLWRRKHRGLIRSLDIRLKKIVLKKYQGIQSQVNFAQFFILNAKILEVMRFQTGNCSESEAFIAEQHRLLQLDKRASRDAQFCFGANRRCHCYFTHVKHVSDLSRTDPFECSC